MGQVVIASRLSDGLVVFLREASKAAGRAEWVLYLADAEVASNQERGEELLAMGESDASANQSVVDIYLIDVKVEGGQLRPTKNREAIRCLGPTMRLDLGKQAEVPATEEN